MRILPVVGRELRTIARRPSAYWVRSGAALAAFLAMAYVALIGAAGVPTGSQGRNLFDLLSLGAFAFCVLAGIRGTSDALSQERREGTLGLLFLTDLKGYDVVLGKFLSVSMNSIYGILAVAPALALAFMVGGTSVLQFVMMIACLLNTLFLSLAIGIFVSSFSQQERPAMGATISILFVILVIPYATAVAHTFGILEYWEAMEPGFLLPSPIFAFNTIRESTLLQILFEEVLLSLAFAHLVGWLCIVTASASLAQRAHLDAPRTRIVSWFANLRHEWAFGKAERRRVLRRSLLDRSAFAWLAARDRLKRRYAWVFLGLLAGLWAFGHWKSPEITDELIFKLFALWLLHFFFKVWVASEVAARFIEDRRSNALELLLTTPLRLRDIITGERLALIRQFGAPILIIIGLNLFVGLRAGDFGSFLIGYYKPILFFGAGIVNLVFDLYAIHWVAIWRSLHLRGTNRTIIQTILLIVIMPTGVWFVMWQVSWIGTGAAVTGATPEQILGRWTALCVVYDLAIAAVARRAFYREFREAATKAFDKPAPFRWKFRRRSSERAETKLTVRPIFTRVRKFAIICATVLVGLHVIVVVRRARLENDLGEQVKRARASGLPFTQTEVAQWRRAIHPDESASGILRRATRMYASANRPPDLFESVAHWNSREPLLPDLKFRLNEWVRTNAELYITLEQLRGRKPGGAIIDERQRNVVMTDDLTRVLQLKARVELEDDPAAAAKSIALELHYARVLQGEPIHAFTGTTRALQSVSELMQRAAIQGHIPAGQWRAWKTLLGEFEPPRMLLENLVIERANGYDTFKMPIEELYQRFGRQLGPFPALFNTAWAIRRYLGQDTAEAIQYLDHMNRYIEHATRPFGEALTADGRYVWREPTMTSSTFIAPQLLPAFQWILIATTEMVAHQRILMTACEIEIFRAAQGRLPNDLTELGGAIPIDPFNGQPLHYVRRGDEYSIYSVGYDMTDNGGAARTGRSPGDVTFNCGAPPSAKAKSSIKYP